ARRLRSDATMSCIHTQNTRSRFEASDLRPDESTTNIGLFKAGTVPGVPHRRCSCEGSRGLDHHRGHPECPQHGEGGTAAQDTVEWRAAKARFSTGTRRRQLFTCRYVLKNGTKGSHKFQEPITRLARPGAKCPHRQLPGTPD